VAFWATFLLVLVDHVSKQCLLYAVGCAISTVKHYQPLYVQKHGYIVNCDKFSENSTMASILRTLVIYPSIPGFTNAIAHNVKLKS
jgi:hypothetical protein